MNSVAALLACNESAGLEQTLASLKQCENVTAVAVVVPSGADSSPAGVTAIPVSGLWSTTAVLDCLQWFRSCGSDALLVVNTDAPTFNPQGIRRMLACMRDTRAAIVYGDYFDMQPDGTSRLHALIDYQPGSIRDTFAFGPALLLNGPLLGEVHEEIGKTAPNLVHGGLYDLRLRLAERAPACRLPEPLYCVVNHSRGAPPSSHFAYVDPRNREYQIEMERVATSHLRRIGAFIEPPETRPPDDNGSFPVVASVVIPVKNRVRTIGDAVNSALSQKASFDYNVIVVDNHSNDGTTEILADAGRADARLVHRVPHRADLLIGGCWNEAIFSDRCGRYAVQLDSDDLYSGTDVLERIVAEFRRRTCAVVIGSYTTVNFDLKPLPPGLIDHREWTDVNGPNNALRIAGLGAPRAYHVPTLRRFGFPNVSYGEDYAVVLRLCRSYPVGRIYDSLYWCRRWEDNTDAALPPETANRYDVYKDRLRTVEIAARQRKEECR